MEPDDSTVLREVARDVKELKQFFQLLLILVIAGIGGAIALAFVFG